MANSINQYIDKEYPAFDSIYNDFLMECKNSSIRQEVINKVEAFKLIPKIILTDLFNWNSVLNNTILIDSENNKTKLKDIFTEDKIYILDCWATWCGPCIQQLPFINNIAKKYKDSVVFVSISFDQDEALWRKHIIKNESNIKYQYNIYNHFNSQFSKYFDLKTIPRYILVSKTGNKIINNKMPYPFLQKEFERILKQNL
jgi:thiol-disulfide isomerase/thioredoxin